MAEQIAWLIERADPRHPGCVLPSCFLGVGGVGPAFRGAQLMWMGDAYNGLRFARREDAEKFIGAIAEMMNGLPYREALEGLRWGDPRPIAVEHSWGL